MKSQVVRDHEGSKSAKEPRTRNTAKNGREKTQSAQKKGRIKDWLFLCRLCFLAANGFSYCLRTP